MAADRLARINNRVAARLTGRASSRDFGGGSLSSDYIALLNYAGSSYPIVQTTMGGINEEKIYTTGVGAIAGNSAVFALTAARIQAFSQIRFQWTRFSGSQPGDLFGTPDLDILEHPWVGGSTAKLLGKMEIDNTAAGNAYIARPRKDMISRLRPDQVIIILGSHLDPMDPADAPDVELAGYMHQAANGKPTFYGPEEIAHYAPIPDPNFHFLGMSWITAALREAQADQAATEHKYRFFMNAATPNLAIKFDPALDIDKVKAFKELMEDEHMGAMNAYKTLYLGGGADPVTVGKDFQQLDFAVTQGKGESRLAAAAGVPPSWVGFSEGLGGSALNASNFSTARRRFSDGTMYHLWQCAAEALEAIVPPTLGRTQRLWFDTRIPFMREDVKDIAAVQAQQAQAISTLVMQGFDPDSCVKAIANNDMTVLKHTGLPSVQLQSGGSATVTDKPATVNAKPAKPADGGQDNGGADA